MYDARRADISRVGAKAANLGELARAGFPVPDGFALTTQAFDLFVKLSRLDETQTPEKVLTVERHMLAETSRRWGPNVLHIWDRGFAGTPWLCSAFVHAARFVMRWPKRYRLQDEQGRLRNAWQIPRGKRSWDHRLLYDARRRCQRKVGVVAVPVQDPTYDQPLWLVVARRGQGQEPWYLLTNEPIRSSQDAWVSC